jgi:serpin B
VLQALGMHRAFSNDADLSGLSDTPTYVNQVVQRDYLQVGELGTTAAAATGVGVSIQSLTITQVELDHPFLFLVRDTQTGAILFASEITDPSA